MACSEITQAVEWSLLSTELEVHPVMAYFTKHVGFGGQYTATKDSVQYAVGLVHAVRRPTLHLKGTLKGYSNGSVDEGMQASPSLTYDVEISDDGTFSYLQMSNGKPVGGLPPTKVMATCVKNDLLTAVSPGGEVVAVGVARKPAYVVPK